MLRIFFKLIYGVNINQKVAGFDCTFYNYLDGFEQVCSYISPVI